MYFIMNVREYTEEQEQKNLMPWACKSSASHRLTEEAQDDLRTAFQRDRDRIIHSKAAALGHDLGHTPFGHAGERAINKYTGHFTHNEQSIRVVTYYGRQGRGLNLTTEVQDAILCHTGNKLPDTPEGAIVRRCDRICYLCSDLDDGIRVGLVGPDKLPGMVAMRLGTEPTQILDILVHNIVECSTGQSKIILDPYYDEAVEEFRNFMFAYVYECPSMEK